jgi:putative holliday junction resolvase
MKLLSVDYGRRRIGIAVTDQTGSCIRGLTTIDRKKYPDTVGRLIAIIDQEKPDTLIFGLPLDIVNNETAMSGEVRDFARQVQQRSKLPVKFVDESNSSIRATELLRFRKKKERRDKGAVDRLAACLLLETYRDEGVVE